MESNSIFDKVNGHTYKLVRWSRFEINGRFLFLLLKKLRNRAPLPKILKGIFIMKNTFTDNLKIYIAPEQNQTGSWALYRKLRWIFFSSHQSWWETYICRCPVYEHLPPLKYGGKWKKKPLKIKPSKVWIPKRKSVHFLIYIIISSYTSISTWMIQTLVPYRAFYCHFCEWMHHGVP